MSAASHFPQGFFGRADETNDAVFYGPTRLVTHIDDGAIAAVSALYDELGVSGQTLDLMGSPRIPADQQAAIIRRENRKTAVVRRSALEA